MINIVNDTLFSFFYYSHYSFSLSLLSIFSLSSLYLLFIFSFPSLYPFTFNPQQPDINCINHKIFEKKKNIFNISIINFSRTDTFGFNFFSSFCCCFPGFSSFLFFCSCDCCDCDCDFSCPCPCSCSCSCDCDRDYECQGSSPLKRVFFLS